MSDKAKTRKQLLLDAIELVRLVVIVMTLALVAAALIDQVLIPLPLDIPDGQRLAYLAGTAAAVCWGCK